MRIFEIMQILPKGKKLYFCKTQAEFLTLVKDVPEQSIIMWDEQGR